MTVGNADKNDRNCCQTLQSYSNVKLHEVIEPQFADFFLRKMLGRPIDYKDLNSLDKELYNNLLTLRNMEDNIEDLGLNFTTNDENNVICPINTRKL